MVDTNAEKHHAIPQMTGVHIKHNFLLDDRDG
jgi:hypothetical protein